jgi:hypothetical protein
MPKVTKIVIRVMTIFVKVACIVTIFVSTLRSSSSRDQHDDMLSVL